MTDSYLFYPLADRQQDEIWLYSAQEWGRDQADIYIYGLHARIKEAANDHFIWARLDEPTGKIPKDVHFVPYRKHYVFFRILPSGRLGVISSLHTFRDLPTRLLEDLTEIEKSQIRLH